MHTLVMRCPLNDISVLMTTRRESVRVVWLLCVFFPLPEAFCSGNGLTKQLPQEYMVFNGAEKIQEIAGM